MEATRTIPVIPWTPDGVGGDAAAWSGWGEPNRPARPSDRTHDGSVDDDDDGDGHPRERDVGSYEKPSKNRVRRERRGHTVTRAAPTSAAANAHTIKDDGGDDNLDMDDNGDVACAHVRPALPAAAESTPLRDEVGDNETDSTHGDSDEEKAASARSTARDDGLPRVSVFCTTTPSDESDGADAEPQAPTRMRRELVVGATRAIDVSEGGGERRQSRSARSGAPQRPLMIMEGDILACRACGAPSAARLSARMGVYVGDGWVVHAVRQKRRGGGDVRSRREASSPPRYDVVQQAVHDFAGGRALAADEWFRTRSEFPAAVRVRRALERVGSEWEVPDGLGDARSSEDFALWAALGQSALTHADYRDERDSPPPRPRRGRHSIDGGRYGDDGYTGGVVARAVRVGERDESPPVLARIHQISAPAADQRAQAPMARPVQPQSDYRYAIAGGIVGFYLGGGPIGGAVGGAAGFLLDSAANIGRAWR